MLPLNGQNQDIGKSVLRSVNLAINKIDDPFLQIFPKNNFFKSFGEVYFNEINYNKKKGWILHKKNQCIFTTVYAEVIFRLFDGRKKSKSFECEELITLSKSKYNVLIVPPGVWFSFTTKKKNQLLQI